MPPNDLIFSLLIHQEIEMDLFFKNLNTQKVENLVDQILNIRANHHSIYFTGVGKSLNMAKHTADMLRSLGISAHLLHPLEALHGDLGTLNPNDLVILYSKSGQTKELQELSFFLKKMKIEMVGVFCRESNLVPKENLIILPCGKELDNDFDLVPTVSILSYTIFCNLLVGGVLKKLNLSQEEYGIHHPSGKIGQKIWLKVEDIMLPLSETCLIDDNYTVIKAMESMITHRTGYALVMKDDQLEGLISDGDIRRYIRDHFEDDDAKLNLQISVQKLMTKGPMTVYSDQKLSQVIEMINQNKSLSVGIPVLDQKKNLIGFLDTKTLLKYHHLL